MQHRDRAPTVCCCCCCSYCAPVSKVCDYIHACVCVCVSMQSSESLKFHTPSLLSAGALGSRDSSAKVRVHSQITPPLLLRMDGEPPCVFSHRLYFIIDVFLRMASDMFCFFPAHQHRRLAPTCWPRLSRTASCRRLRRRAGVELESRCSADGDK